MKTRDAAGIAFALRPASRTSTAVADTTVAHEGRPIPPSETAADFESNEREAAGDWTDADSVELRLFKPDAPP
jgi:hypothetical protein